MRDARLDFRLVGECSSLRAEWPDLLNSFRRGKPSATAVQAFAERIKALLRRAARLPVTRYWRVAIAGLQALAAHHEMAIAATKNGDVAGPRHRLAVLLQSLSVQCNRVRRRGLRSRLLASFDASAVSVDRGRAVRTLLALPLPTLYMGVEPDRYAKLRRRELSPPPEAVPVLKVLATLDRSPLVTPHILKAGVVYPLGVRVKGSRWPSDAVALHLRWLTTCPPNLYDLSPLRVRRPSGDGEFDTELATHIRFPSPQTSLAEDFVFVCHCSFETRDGGFTEAAVVGHHELRFRAADVPLVGVDTGDRQVDLHLAGLLRRLRSSAPSAAEELPDLLKVLETLVFVIGTFTQEGLFKGRGDVTEREFQQQVVRAMRMRLGPDVQEHNSLAGGILDILYRRVVVELKVEKATGDRRRIAEKYSAQPTQYAAATARQVSVVFVLDLTEKLNPPADIRNDILLVDVPTHGGGDADKPFPSKAFVLVLNGNIRNPSSYS